MSIYTVPLCDTCGYTCPNGGKMGHLSLDLSCHLSPCIYTYTYIYSNTFIYTYIFDGACLTTVILAPGAEGGLRAAGQVALQSDCLDPGNWRDPRMNSGGPTFVYRLRTREPFAWNWSPVSDHKTRRAAASLRPRLRVQVH